MSKSPKKLVFELDAKQIIFVFIGLVIVGFMVFKIGVVTGSRSAREELLQVRLNEDPRQKIKAPSLLQEEKALSETKPQEEKQPTIEGVLAKANEEGGIKNNEKEKVASTQKKHSAPEKVEEAQVKKEASSEKKSTPAKGEAKPAKSQGESYFVQVASFPSAADARKRGAELEKKGYSVVIVKADIPGKGTYHRVRLGPFNSLSKAKSFALGFEKKEKVSTFIPID